MKVYMCGVVKSGQRPKAVPAYISKQDWRWAPSESEGWEPDCLCIAKT